jgi:hypothetical protein
MTKSGENRSVPPIEEDSFAKTENEFLTLRPKTTTICHSRLTRSLWRLPHLEADSRKGLLPLPLFLNLLLAPLLLPPSLYTLDTITAMITCG